MRKKKHPGVVIGEANREAIRRFLREHLGATNVECADALGLSVVAVGRHVRQIRAEWNHNT